MLPTEKLADLVLSAKIDDMHIRTVLDTGFINMFRMTGETHAHAYYELLVAVDTDFFVDLPDRKELRITPGSVCLLPPGIYHCTRKAGEDSRMLALRFDCTREGDGKTYEICRQGLSRRSAAELLPDCTRLCAAVRKLAGELGGGQLGEAAYAESLLVQIYIELFRRLCGDPDDVAARQRQSIDEQDVRRLRIEEYFISHYSEPVVAEDLAREMNLSRRQLGRVLEKTYGMGFRKLLVEARLQHAAQLLRESDLPVATVAAQVGYTSLSGFYTAFAERFGTSAVKYRKNSGAN
ncbi:MAG: helix-turn-helix transcriptional regulator [Clostridia bacterium]|nr:helix-turn-helix transcriptional regulator [Clostridia bacterium]